MSIKVTFEFPGVEEAIIALGKLSGLGKARRAANQTTGAPAGAAPAHPAQVSVAPPSTPPAAPVTGTPRKPRADKGKPRGPYNKTDSAAPDADCTSREVPAAPAAPVAAEPTPPAPAEAPIAAPVSSAEADAGSPQGPVTGAAPVPTVEEAVKAGEALLAAKGLEAVRALIQTYGVARISAIPAEKRAEFIAKAQGK